jgi:diguanylate cyclase (GGDEF)-like protein
VLSGLIILVLSVFVGLFTHMVLRLRESNRELTILSYTDKLTNFLNRRSYEEAQARLRCEALPENLVIMAADVNGLKHVNDTMGHEAGDELICGAANCLQACIGEYGTLFRIGGDEFSGILTLSERELAAARTQLAVRLADWHGAKAGSLSLACGFAGKQEFPGANIMDLTRTADKRMYDEKAIFHQQKKDAREMDNIG